MSHTFTVEQAAARLADLLSSRQPGDEITLMDHDRPVARIIPEARNALPPRGFGACKEMLIENREVDDDVHLAEFKDYM